MDPEPEQRAQPGQGGGDVERDFPTETVGENRGEGGGNSSPQMDAHVHKASDRAGVRAGQVERRSKNRTGREKQGATSQREKQHRDIRVRRPGPNKDRPPTEQQAAAANPTASDPFPQPLAEVV